MMPLMGMWPYLYPAMPSPTGPEVQSPHFQPIPSQLRSEANTGQAQGLPACNLPGCKNMHPGVPGEGCFHVGKREDDILWLHETCGRTEGLPFKTSCPGGWPFSSQKQVLRTHKVTTFPRGFIWGLHLAGAPSM